MKTFYTLFTLTSLVIFINPSLAQNTSWGMSFRAGLSQNIPPITNQNILLESPLLSLGTSIYWFIPIVKETSGSPFKTVKLNVSPISIRSAYYEVDNSTIKLDRLFTDIDLLIPIRLKYSSDSEIYFAFGPALGILLFQDAKPETSTININKQYLQPGIGFEFGFLFMGTSTAGIRTNRYFGDYPVLDMTVFIGFGFDSIKRGFSNSLNNNR